MKILLVEDDLSARLAMQRYLEFAGHDVAATGDPEEAVLVAQEFEPEVLICDWELGALKDGVDVAHELQHDETLEVIFITGQNLSELKKVAADVEINVKAFFRKPVSLQQINACLG